jgi:hypothetical protein
MKGDRLQVAGIREWGIEIKNIKRNPLNLK